MTVEIEVWGDNIAKAAHTRTDGGHVFELSFEGATLGHRSQGIGGGDSISDALVWNETTQRLEVVNYQYTGLGGSDYNSADDDATPEVWAKVKALIFSKVVDILRGGYEQDAAEISSGKRVKVVAGRKVPRGTLGTVKFTGESQYGFYARVAWDSGDEGFIDQHNIEVDNPDAYMVSDEKILAEAERHWRSYAWACVYG